MARNSPRTDRERMTDGKRKRDGCRSVQRGADGRGEFVVMAGTETPKAMAMSGQWSCRVREPTTQTGMGRSSIEGRSHRESPEGGSGGASGTKPAGREPHKKQGIDGLSRRGFCVLTLFSSKVSPGRFPETSTFYGGGRREGFGEPPGGNAISCRAVAGGRSGRPARTGGPAGHQG